MEQNKAVVFSDSESEQRATATILTNEVKEGIREIVYEELRAAFRDIAPERRETGFRRANENQGLFRIDERGHFVKVDDAHT